MKQRAQRRKTATKTAKRKASPKKAATQKKASRKTAAKQAKRTPRGGRRSESRLRDRSTSSPETSGLESGDLQGLSNTEDVDSESVDELLEEGNAFEAGVVSGVEDSAGREGKEVRTREVPEDDVPEEYLDEK